MVSIPDSATNEFLVDSVNSLPWDNNGIWIGLNDITNEQDWRWAGLENGKIYRNMRNKKYLGLVILYHSSIQTLLATIFQTVACDLVVSST